MISVTQVIEKLFNEYELNHNKNNVAKLRRKAQRTLMNLGYWQNAPIQVIGKQQHKVFTIEQIEKLEKELKLYLENRLEEYKATEKKKISKDEINELMLQALFFEKFELDLEAWERDVNIISKFKENDTEYDLIKNRLNNKLNSYVKRKEK